MIFEKCIDLFKIIILLTFKFLIQINELALKKIFFIEKYSNFILLQFFSLISIFQCTAQKAEKKTEM